MSRGVPLIRQLNLRLAILSILPFTRRRPRQLSDVRGPSSALLAAAIVWAYLLVTLFIRRRLLAHHRAGLRDHSSRSLGRRQSATFAPATTPSLGVRPSTDTAGSSSQGAA